jgi:hypothetical protein
MDKRVEMGSGMGKMGKMVQNNRPQIDASHDGDVELLCSQFLGFNE